MKRYKIVATYYIWAKSDKKAIKKGLKIEKRTNEKFPENNFRNIGIYSNEFGDMVAKKIDI